MADPTQSLHATRPSAQSYTACHQVLATPELLEAILHKLNPSDEIILAQRINSTFRNCIRSSPSLQQRLFFQRQPTKNIRTRHPKVNHFLFDRLRIQYELESRFDLLVEYRPRTVKCPLFCVYSMPRIQKITEDDHASCLNMYCSQSASRHIEICVDSCSPKTGEGYAAFIKVKEQPFGDLIEIAGSLQRLTDCKWEEIKEHTVYDRGSRKTEERLDPDDRIAWTDFFTAEQRDTIFGTPNFRFDD